MDAIVDLLWGDRPPPGVAATLQAYVSQLRRVLEPDRERRAPATVLVTVAPGYALRVPDEPSTPTVRAAGRRPAPQRCSRSPWGRRRSGAELGAVTAPWTRRSALWRGTPYAELGDAAAAVAERARLEELRLVALEDRAVAGLALGHHATVAAELEALTAAHPLRERLWALRALALTRSGRQADALEVLRRVRDGARRGARPGAVRRAARPADRRAAPGPGAGLGRRRSRSSPARRPCPTRPPSRARRCREPAPWPMVGRDADLAALDRAGRARPAPVVRRADR